MFLFSIFCKTTVCSRFSICHMASLLYWIVWRPMELHWCFIRCGVCLWMSPTLLCGFGLLFGIPLLPNYRFPISDIWWICLYWIVWRSLELCWGFLRRGLCLTLLLTFRCTFGLLPGTPLCPNVEFKLTVMPPFLSPACSSWVLLCWSYLLCLRVAYTLVHISAWDWRYLVVCCHLFATLCV